MVIVSILINVLLYTRLLILKTGFMLGVSYIENNIAHIHISVQFPLFLTKRKYTCSTFFWHKTLIIQLRSSEPKVLRSLRKALRLPSHRSHPPGPGGRSALWKPRPGCRVSRPGTADSASGRCHSSPCPVPNGCSVCQTRDLARRLGQVPLWKRGANL